jgi:hypothetical protein
MVRIRGFRRSAARVARTERAEGVSDLVMTAWDGIRATDPVCWRTGTCSEERMKCCCFSDMHRSGVGRFLR